VTVVELATEADDTELRRLLRETPMTGRIRLTLEREPSFFAAARVEAERHHTVCARDAGSGRVLGMGSRSVRQLWVNGRPLRVGYLSQLRVAQAQVPRGGHLVRAGFRLLANTRAADEAPFDLTTIVVDNTPARRLLEAGKPGLPRYRPVEPFVTMLLPVRARGGRRGERPVRPGAGARHGHGLDAYQFAPVWSSDELQRFGPAHERSGNCLAIWDQRSFKQAVVRSYAPWLRRFRWLAGLPKPGTVLPVAALVALAMNDAEPAAFLDLLDEALAAAGGTDCRWLMLALAARHPFANLVRRRYRPLVYDSLLYLVHDPGVTVELDGRVAHVEVSLL
jgi:hypothetical protein